MSPEARVATGIAEIVPVAVAATLVLALADPMWWLIFTFGWAIFPAFGLLIRGIAGLWDEEDETPTGDAKERELLGALREYGKLTPARAAMETSLTVAEADGMLKGLAEGGHLEGQGEGWRPLLRALGERGGSSRLWRTSLSGVT